MSYQYGGWSNIRMQPQQQPPRLPPGWEAKWDPNNGRWFYVDHSTKTTHWELPAAARQPSPQPQRVTTSFINGDPAKVKVFVDEYEGLTKEYVTSLLRVYQNNMTSVRRIIEEKGYRKKQAPLEAKEQFVQGLKAQYPAAGEEIIREVLVNTSNSFVGARMALESMGYKKKGTESATVKTNKKTTRPATAAAKSTVKKPATTTSSDLSDQTKQSRLQQLKKKFPTVAERVVKLSLEGTMYDMDMASAILSSSIDAVKTKSSTSTTSTSTARKPKSKETFPTHSTPEHKPASLAPVIFGADDDENKPKPYEPEVPSTSTIDVPPQATYTKPEVTYKRREYKPPPKKTYTRPNVPTTGYVSANRRKPVGPDPSLVKGPNSSLLQAEFSRVIGPNPANRRGPQRSNRCGPLRSNARGRAGIDVGPMQGHLIHSAV